MLVGKGPYEEQARALARELGLAGAVTFVGAVPHEEIPAYYRAADLFVFSSKTETQGLVLLESLAASTPVVAVEAPGASDVLSRGGRLTQPNRADLARGMLEVLGEEGLIERLAREAQDVVMAYSIASAAERMIAVYEGVLAEFGSRSD